MYHVRILYHTVFLLCTISAYYHQVLPKAYGIWNIQTIAILNVGALRIDLSSYMYLGLHNTLCTSFLLLARFRASVNVLPLRGPRAS